MAAKITLAVGLLFSALALPQVVASLVDSKPQLVQQQFNRIEPDIYQVPDCDPVNDPSSCRSS